MSSTEDAVSNTSNTGEKIVEKPRRFNRDGNEEERKSSSGDYYKTERWDSDGKGRRGRGGFGFKKKKCRFCSKKPEEIAKELNYKNIELLSRFVSERGKILAGRITGCCALHQRRVKVELKKARYMALLPFLKVEKINK